MSKDKPVDSVILQRHIHIRVAAGASVALGLAGLHVLGAQAFAVGLFSSPWDKVAHVMAFAMIGGASGLASGTRGWRRTLYCVAGAVLVGAMDEWHQFYLPGRHASLADLWADAAGGMLAATLLRLECWRAHRRV
jgi:hypothetical protein